MGGWGIMLAVATSLGGGLIFLSFVADDLLRATADLENQRFRMLEDRKERLEYEAAQRRAQAEADAAALSESESDSADADDSDEVFTAKPS